MTDKTKNWMNKISVTLGVIVIIVGFIAYITRAIDLSQQTAMAVEKISCKLESEIIDRVAEDKILTNLINTEKEERKADNSLTMVKLAEIDMKLFFIQQGQDKIINYVNSERKN